MGIGEVLVLVTGMGCATGVVCMVVDKVFGSREQRSKLELRTMQDRLALLEKQNDHLNQQLEWQSRLLEGSYDQHRVAEAEKAVALPHR